MFSSGRRTPTLNAVTSTSHLEGHRGQPGFCMGCSRYSPVTPLFPTLPPIRHLSKLLPQVPKAESQQGWGCGGRCGLGHQLGPQGEHSVTSLPDQNCLWVCLQPNIGSWAWRPPGHRHEEVALRMNRASLWHQAVWLWQVTLVQRLKISPLVSLQGRTLTGPVGVHGRSAGPGRSQCDSMCRCSMHALPSCPLWPGRPCLHGERQIKNS